jgi:hypothetical protein
MPGVLVASNVLLDVLTEDREWFTWSSEALARCADDAEIVINPIVYAEVSIGFERIEEVESALPPEAFVRSPLPWDAAFLAGKCFQSYKRRGGRKRSRPGASGKAHLAQERGEARIGAERGAAQPAPPAGGSPRPSTRRPAPA